MLPAQAGGWRGRRRGQAAGVTRAGRAARARARGHGETAEAPGDLVVAVLLLLPGQHSLLELARARHAATQSSGPWPHSAAYANVSFKHPPSSLQIRQGGTHRARHLCVGANIVSPAAKMVLPALLVSRGRCALGENLECAFPFCAGKPQLVPAVNSDPHWRQVVCAPLECVLSTWCWQLGRSVRISGACPPAAAGCSGGV